MEGDGRGRGVVVAVIEGEGWKRLRFGVAKWKVGDGRGGESRLNVGWGE